jgi:V/A-type H+/Na+-transporting ATPase subunit C
MASGGVSGYAALNARVRVMYSTLINPQVFASLYEAADLNAFISLLKNTEYGPYLDRAKDKELTARRAAFLIRERLTDAYQSIIRTAPENARPLLIQRFRYFEVDNLKAVLRGIIAGAGWDRVRFVLFPMGDLSVIPAQEMVEAGAIAAAVELLRGTPYYETLSHALKRFSTEQNIFPLEVALDLSYWRELWKDMNQLSSEDRTQAMKIIGTLVDTTNLMWAIRYREYHHLSEEELINYTLPFGYHVRDEDVRAVAAGADISQVVKRIYPHIVDVDAFLQEPRKGLPLLEFQLRRQVVTQCHNEFVGNPFHIGLPLAFLQLLEMEIQDITVLLEAKSAAGPHEDFRPFILMGQPSRS